MIPMIDLGVQYNEIKEEVLREINEVLESSRYILGPKVKEFEEMVAGYYGVAEAVGVASGTDALNLSLKALDIRNGDEVVTTPFTFFATVEAILYQGAMPVFVDIDPETFNISPQGIEDRITEKTRAIIPVHMFGLPADMARIGEIASRYNLHVIEDCAQAFGADINGGKVGSFGDAGCFSFYPSKNLGAYGDGGIVTTASKALSERMRILRNHGSEGGYIHRTVGMNSRLDEIQAAVLIVKLRRIDHYNRLRREKAAFYTERLRDVVRCPEDIDGYHHVFHQYTITTPRRDRLMKALGDEGVSSVIYYPLPLHLQDALIALGYKKGGFPNAERASSEVLSLPLYPEIESETQERICDIIIKTIKD